MYPIELTDGFTAHRHLTAGSAPSHHQVFWGRPVDSYEGHVAWRPAVVTASEEEEWDDLKANEDRAFEQAWIGSDPARRAAL